MQTPTISIIIPVYNVERYLKRCIESIINQTLENIEIILVDDQSPDNCPQLCDEYAKKDPRIKVIHKKNGGLGLARNSGIEIATGEYIAFIDSDDFLDLNTYETIYNITKQKNLDVCYFKFCRYYSNGRIKPTADWNQEAFFEGREQVDTFLLDMVGPNPEEKINEKYSMSACKAIYRRSILEKYNIRFVSERVVASEDLIFHLDFLPKVERVGYIPKAFYFYFVNTASITTTYSEEKLNRLFKLMIEVEKRLEILFEGKIYRSHYYSQLMRIIKVIIKFESISKAPLSLKFERLNTFYNNSIFTELYKRSENLSRINRLYVYCMKYNISILFILYYNFVRKIHQLQH